MFVFGQFGFLLSWLLADVQSSLYFSMTENLLRNWKKYPGTFYCLRSDRWFLLVMFFHCLDTFCVHGLGSEGGSEGGRRERETETGRENEHAGKLVGCIFTSESLSVHCILLPLGFIPNSFLRIQIWKHLKSLNPWTIQNLEMDAGNAYR